MQMTLQPTRIRKALESTRVQKMLRQRGADLATMVLLLALAFVFLFPILFMVSTSLKSVPDLRDPTVYWIPTEFIWVNFKYAWQLLKFNETGLRSGVIALVTAVAQVISCGLVGYGFARYKFPGRDILFVLVILTFLIPPQTMVVSLFILYKKLNWINTYNPFIVTSFFAQGLKGALFIIIFRQFFKNLPWELEEAGRIDGASGFRIFGQIMLPLSIPAILVVFLFSLVWHWNDYYEPMMYLNDAKKFTLPLRLDGIFALALPSEMSEAGQVLSENILMAACLLVVAPPILLYLFTQRYFVQGLERTGITGQ